MPPAEHATVRAQNSRVGGKYVLNRRLAVGGMGDIWLAKNTTTEAQVALKILRPTDDDVRTQARDRFRREAKLGGLLAHRNIIRIFDFLEEPDETLVLVMELLRGDSLDHYIERRGALETHEAIAIMVPLLAALEHGHQHGIVHRDVKPANVYLAVDPDGRVTPKLLDFGIAKMRSSGKKTIDGVVLGTPSYMSPEQINAEPITPASDLFSAGVLLYELLTGVCPFDAPTPSAAIAAVLMSEVDPDPRIDPRLWIEIQRALKKRPKERHASAKEMSDALLAAIGATEDALATSMRRSRPPSFHPLSEPAPTMNAPPAFTKSLGGQSVGLITQRRGPSAATLALTVLAVAVVAIAAGTAIRAVRPNDARANAAAITAASASAASLSAASNGSNTPTTPSDGARATSGDVSNNLVSPASVPRSAGERANGGQSASGQAPSNGSNAAHRTHPKAPKPIATSPGF